MIRFALAVFAFLLICAAAHAAICEEGDECETTGESSSRYPFHGFLDQPSSHSDEPLGGFSTRGSGWTNTASGSSGIGQPAELTWSIVPDGTSLPRGLGEPGSPSNLISFLDTLHHAGASPGGSDITQRDWFPLVESSFQRWDELSGISFTHETDDGAPLPNFSGVLGVRGDHRIGGHSIDGEISPTFLAYNYFPNISDMVIDTDEVMRWGNPDANYIRFRNMLMHEVGHGLGFNHVVSSDANILMGPFLAVEFDGPQLDDILAAHRLYGDANEEGVGNETFLNSTSLGKFWPGQSITVGTDAVDTIVEFDDVDFLSIDANNDIDFFRFTVLTPSIIDLQLDPLGPTYLQGSSSSQSPFNTASQSDLSLTLWDKDGNTILETAHDHGIGLGESLSDVFLFEPGDYYVSVTGAQNAAQFYQLGLDVSAPIPTSEGIFGNIVRDFAERAGFGRFFGSSPLLNIYSIPEPATGVLLGWCGMFIAVRRRRNGR